MGRYSTSLLAFAYLCIVLLGTAAAGQNQSTLLKLYGGPIGDVYQTHQLTITAEFARNGDLCRAYIGAADKKITDVELDPILDELAPVNARGKLKMGTFLDNVCLPDDDCYGVEEDYERLQIARMGNTNAYNSVVITYHRHECKGLNKR